MSVTLIDYEQARQIPPHLCAPPLCTTDARVPGVGAAHGRVLPLVGNTRPYLYDITIVGTDNRIYADRITDILAVLIGENYADIAKQIEQLDVTDIGDVGDTPAAGDVLPPELAASAVADDDVASAFDADDRIRRHQEVQYLLYDMALLRTAFASRVRIAMQEAINAEAVASGLWKQLTDDEREELTKSATEGGGFPIGIPGEVPVLVDADTAPRTTMMIRPEWRAETRLVLNTGDYNPWTPAPMIESLREAVDTDGTRFEYPTDENVVTLTIDTEQELIDSLVAAGYLTMDIRPAYQPDPMYHDFVDDPVSQPYLRRDGSEDADATITV